MLRRLSGSGMMAKLIWGLGLPNISDTGFARDKVLPATEQQGPLQQDVRDAIETATDTILNWLSRLADLTQDHKATDTYQEHARKSGTEKHKSGLNEVELRLKEEKKQAARLKYGRQTKTPSRTDTWPSPAECHWHVDTWQTSSQWPWPGGTWQPPAHWPGPGVTWQAPPGSQWHGGIWQTRSWQ